MSKLHAIAQRVSERLVAEKNETPYADLLRAAQSCIAPSDFAEAFTVSSQNSPPIIAEIKFTSPSQGVLRVHHDPVAVAQGYLENGARALSILTEQDYFSGKPEYLKLVRKAFPQALILRKDFITDEYQLVQARLWGANAALLIVALLDPAQLRDLYQQTLALKMTPLIEVHDQVELETALALSPQMIGINNRNLKNFAVSLKTSRDLIKDIPKNIIAISESGIENSSDLAELSRCGYRGFLIGTKFMREPNPGRALAEFLIG